MDAVANKHVVKIEESERVKYTIIQINPDKNRYY
jgi:hypothetical protein